LTVNYHCAIFKDNKQLLQQTKSSLKGILFVAYQLNQPTKMTGVIKKTMEKGFGFIAPNEGGKDIFFHSNSLVDVKFDELREGDTVTFEVENTEKGMNAINVSRA
jgi:CspA family cold shock protein